MSSGGARGGTSICWGARPEFRARRSRFRQRRDLDVGEGRQVDGMSGEGRREEEKNIHVGDDEGQVVGGSPSAGGASIAAARVSWLPFKGESKVVQGSPCRGLDSGEMGPGQSSGSDNGASVSAP